MLLKNKTGGEKLLSIWWLFTIALVGAGIAIGVSMFYSAEVDVRNVEAEILSDRIMDCLFEQGFLVEGFGENFDVFSECKLNKNVIEENFYFRISFADENGAKKEISKGIKESACILTDNEKKGCVKKTRSIVYEQDNKIKKGSIEILTASNQVGQKISISG